MPAIVNKFGWMQSYTVCFYCCFFVNDVARHPLKTSIRHGDSPWRQQWNKKSSRRYKFDMEKGDKVFLTSLNSQTNNKKGRPLRKKVTAMKTKIISYALVFTLGSALCFASPLLAQDTGKPAGSAETYETGSTPKSHKQAKQKHAKKHSASAKKSKAQKTEKVSE